MPLLSSYRHLFNLAFFPAARLSLTNILRVSEEVTEWEEVGVHLSVPPDMTILIYRIQCFYNVCIKNVVAICTECCF